jgi:hypothetical protein
MCDNSAQQRALAAALLPVLTYMYSCMYLHSSGLRDCIVPLSVSTIRARLVYAHCTASRRCTLTQPSITINIANTRLLLVPVLALPQEALFSIVLYPAIDISQLVVATQHEQLVWVLNLVCACSSMNDVSRHAYNAYITQPLLSAVYTM